MVEDPFLIDAYLMLPFPLDVRFDQGLVLKLPEELVLKKLFSLPGIKYF